MTQTELILLLNEYEEKILTLIDDQDEFTRSDLQGAVMAVARQIFAAGQKHGQTMASK